MPKPNTGIIPSWRSAPCGGCGRRKGENELLDDMDFDRYGKVKCSKIEQMLPKLMNKGKEIVINPTKCKDVEYTKVVK